MDIDGELEHHYFFDPDTGMNYTLAFTDPLSHEQMRFFNTLTQEARDNGETDLRVIFAYAEEKFNEEAKRQGWVARIRTW